MWPDDTCVCGNKKPGGLAKIACTECGEDGCEKCVLTGPAPFQPMHEACIRNKLTEARAKYQASA